MRPGSSVQRARSPSPSPMSCRMGLLHDDSLKLWCRQLIRLQAVYLKLMTCYKGFLASCSARKCILQLCALALIENGHKVMTSTVRYLQKFSCTAFGIKRHGIIIKCVDVLKLLPARSNTSTKRITVVIINKAREIKCIC